MWFFFMDSIGYTECFDVDSTDLTRDGGIRKVEITQCDLEVTVLDAAIGCSIDSALLIASTNSPNDDVDFFWAGPFDFTAIGNSIKVTQPGMYIVFCKSRWWTVLLWIRQ